MLSPCIRLGTGRPASSRKVGAISRFVTIWSTRRPGTHHSRITNQHGRPYGWLVHESLIVLAPFSEEEPVVGGEHDGGIVELAHIGKRLEQLAHVLVGGDDPGVVVLDHFLQGAGAIAFGLRAPDIRSDAVVGLGECARLAGVSLQVVVEGGGLGDRDAVIQIQKPPGRKKGACGDWNQKMRQNGFSRFCFIHRIARSITTSST